MIRVAIIGISFAVAIWFILGWIAAKAEIRWEKTEVNGPPVRFFIFLFFILGALGYLAAWLTIEDQMREVHNMPPRQYKSKRLRKTWTERFFGE